MLTRLFDSSPTFFTKQQCWIITLFHVSPGEARKANYVLPIIWPVAKLNRYNVFSHNHPHKINRKIEVFPAGYLNYLEQRQDNVANPPYNALAELRELRLRYNHEETSREVASVSSRPEK